MKVKELKKYLNSLPEGFDDVLVVLQKDAEGNGYSPLSGVDDAGIWIPENTWSGDVYSANWSAEDADMDEDSWEEFKEENDKCVVLFPIN